MCSRQSEAGCGWRVVLRSRRGMRSTRCELCLVVGRRARYMCIDPSCERISITGPGPHHPLQVRQHMMRLPSIDPTTRTIIIAGYPNVGKSSFMNKVSRTVMWRGGAWCCAWLNHIPSTTPHPPHLDPLHSTLHSSTTHTHRIPPHSTRLRHHPTPHRISHRPRPLPSRSLAPM